MEKTDEQWRSDFEAWALPILHELADVLLLRDFEPIEIEYKKMREQVAECECGYPYKSIMIRYSEELLEDYKQGKLANVVSVLTHEMCHPLTDPLYVKAVQVFKTREEVEAERERLTDHIANIVLRAKLTPLSQPTSGGSK